MFKRNFIRLCNKHGVAPTVVCQSIGLTGTAFSKWTDESVPRKATLMRIADYFDVSVESLTGDEPSGKGVRIPVFGSVAAGIPIEAITDIEDYEEISEALAKTGEFVALKIKGDSMTPLMIEGDTVIVRIQDTADTGDIAVVMVGGSDATCKKIRRTADGIVLISINNAYDPMFFTNAEIESLPVRIFGKVVEMRRVM